MSKGREEILCLMMCGLAWLLILFPQKAGIWVPLCMTSGTGPSHVFIELNMHQTYDFKQAMHHHGLMIFAMMLPFSIPLIRHVRTRVVHKWRQIAIGSFILGFILTWMLAGVFVSLLHVKMAQSGQPPTFAFLAALLAVILWQDSPIKTKSLIACHKTEPLAAYSFPVIHNSLLYGMKRGLACMKSCGNLMFVPAVFGSSAGIMLAVFFIALTERYGILTNAVTIKIAILLCATITWLGIYAG